MEKSRKKSWKKIPAHYYSGQGEYSGGQGVQNIQEEEEEEEFPPLLHTIFEPSEDEVVGQGVVQEVLEEEQRPQCNYCLETDNEDNLIRPCLKAADWHYGYLCYWITACNDWPCTICHQKYQDPRIRRVMPSFWNVLPSISLGGFICSIMNFGLYLILHFGLWTLLTEPTVASFPEVWPLIPILFVICLIVNICLVLIIYKGLVEMFESQRNNFTIIFADFDGRNFAPGVQYIWRSGQQPLP